MTSSKSWRCAYTALTCDGESCSAAGDGSQVVDSGHALVGALIRFVVLGVHHVEEEE